MFISGMRNYAARVAAYFVWDKRKLIDLFGVSREHPGPVGGVRACTAENVAPNWKVMRSSADSAARKHRFAVHAASVCIFRHRANAIAGMHSEDPLVPMTRPA